MYTNAMTFFWLFLAILFCVGYLLMSLTTYFNLKYLDSGFNFYYLYGKLRRLKKGNDTSDSGNKNLRKSGLNLKGELNISNRQETDSNQFGCSLPIAAQIPKSWFRHFYAIGAVAHIIMLNYLISVLVGNPLPYSIRNIIHWVLLGSDQRGLNNNAWPLIIVFFLVLVQILKRLYECLFISAFSKSTMSIFHYFIGVFFYSSFGIGLMSSVNMEDLVFPDPSYVEIISYFLGVLMFFWSAYYQHKSMHTFASLRKEQKGYRPDAHYIPHGHLFEWVSCPHYFCEILIYISFCFIFQFNNIFILSIATFVLTNQIVCSILVHKWYQQHFPNYPKFRAAVFPYIL